MSGFKNRYVLSHSTSSQRAQDQGVGRFVSVWGLSPWLADGHLLTESSHGLSSVHMHPSCLCAPKFPLFIRTPVKLDWHPHEWLHFNLIISLKTLSWNPGIFWVIQYKGLYGCESWTIRKAERWRIDAFELWCWRRLLRVPWTARRSNQSILKEIYPEYSLEGLVLKLKLQYFGHLMWRTDSLVKTLMLGKIEGRRRRGRQKMRWQHDITDTMDISLSKLREIVKNREPWHAAVHGVAKRQTQPSNWTTITDWDFNMDIGRT